MTFRESLQHLVDNVPGAVSAMIMGFDGIALESYDREGGGGGIDLPTLLIEYSGATQQLRRVVETVPEVGAVTEVAIERSSGTCLLRPLSDEYFMAVIVRPDGLTGKARYLMRMLAPQILQELS